MKGTLQFIGGKWYIIYKSDEGNQVRIDVKPDRIAQLAYNDVYLKNGEEVEFNIIEVSDFPYRWAVPIIKQPEDEYGSSITAMTINTETVRIKTQLKIELFFSGFDEITEKTIVCDGYDNSSSGYWYFFNRDENNNRSYLFASPISKTIFNSIEPIETQY